MDTLKDKIFVGVLGAKWWFYRYEFQNRGTVHCHGLLKLNEPPIGVAELGNRLR